MLILPLARASRFVLVRPHYPENVGAVARAMKTMGLTQLVLVRPGRLALPEHENAFQNGCSRMGCARQGASLRQSR